MNGEQSGPVITAVTDIAAPPEAVWRVLTDFAAYSQWHPVLSFVDVPTAIVPGTQLRAQVSSGSPNDGEYTFTVLHYEAPRRLEWEGGVPELLAGRHSFVLEPHGGGTRFTDSEEFTGTAGHCGVRQGRPGAGLRQQRQRPEGTTRGPPQRDEAMNNTLGIIGSSMLGGAVARLAVNAGMEVVLSNSRGPETLRQLTADLGPRARAATPAEAAAAGDWTVVAVPSAACPTCPRTRWRGRSSST
jgi:hypothetical protein